MSSIEPKGVHSLYNCIQDYRSKKLSPPEKGARFLLPQFVTDCDMLYAIFLNFLNCL